MPDFQQWNARSCSPEAGPPQWLALAMKQCHYKAVAKTPGAHVFNTFIPLYKKRQDRCAGRRAAVRLQAAMTAQVPASLDVGQKVRINDGVLAAAKAIAVSVKQSANLPFCEDS
jgi:hypothetical protein